MTRLISKPQIVKGQKQKQKHAKIKQEHRIQHVFLFNRDVRLFFSIPQISPRKVHHLHHPTLSQHTVLAISHIFALAVPSAGGALPSSPLFKFANCPIPQFLSTCI